MLPCMGFQTLEPLFVRLGSLPTRIIKERKYVWVVFDSYYYIVENMSQIVNTLSSFS